MQLGRETGASLQWLLTGEGPRYAAPDVNDAGTPLPPDLLKRIVGLLTGGPHLLRPLRAFVELLEKTSEWPSPETTEPGPPSPGQAPVRRRSGWVPVIGRTAAGHAHFWRDYDPDLDAAEFDRRIDQWVIGARKQTTQAGLAAELSDQRDGQTAPPASLVQLAAPDERGIIEFLDASEVAAKHARAVAWRIDGDSMSPRYEDGDLVICCPCSPAVDGQPAVVKLHNQIGITCKIYRLAEDGLRLCSVNEKFAPIETAPSDVRWALRVLYRIRLELDFSVHIA